MKVSFQTISSSFVKRSYFSGQTDCPSEPHAGRGHLRADGHRAAQRHRPSHPRRSLRRRQGPSVSIWVREVRRWSFPLLALTPLLFRPNLCAGHPPHCLHSATNWCSWVKSRECRELGVSYGKRVGGKLWGLKLGERGLVMERGRWVASLWQGEGSRWGNLSLARASPLPICRESTIENAN